MEKLLELRKQDKKTQIDLANYLGVAQASYRRYECGEAEPNIENLIKLADFYHVTLDYLVGRQFASDAGYLTDAEKQLLAMFRSMTDNNKKTLLAEAGGFLLVQNSNK